MSHHHRRAAAVSAPDPYFSNTVLLLTGNGTNGGQNNTFIDSSSNNFTITRYGNVTQGSFSPFSIATGSEYSTGTNGGSGYFDGSSDVLGTSNSSAWAFGTGDLTIEFWFYVNAFTSGGMYYMSQNSGSSPNWYVFSDSSTLFRFGRHGANQYHGFTTTLSTGQWYHVAIVRSGTTMHMFLNGVSQTLTSSGGGVGSFNFSSNTELYIAGLNSTSGNNYNGYMSNLRILKGTAQYTSNFTPSTTPLTAITNTSLLLNFVNGSIVDATGKNDLETVGNAQISTTVKKYGTGSLAFDGTDDALKFPISPNVQLGSGDWTIEAWVNITAHKDYNFVYSYGPPVEFYTRAGGYLALFLNDSDNLTSPIVNIQTTATISTGQWTHVAAVRNGSNFTLYINGVSSATATSSAAIASSATQPSVGNYASTAGSQYAMNGNIDDLRITKTARYTANFTPPYRQLPTR